MNKFVYKINEQFRKYDSDFIGTNSFSISHDMTGYERETDVNT